MHLRVTGPSSRLTSRATRACAAALRPGVASAPTQHGAPSALGTSPCWPSHCGPYLILATRLQRCEGLQHRLERHAQALRCVLSPKDPERLSAAWFSHWPLRLEAASGRALLRGLSIRRLPSCARLSHCSGCGTNRAASINPRQCSRRQLPVLAGHKLSSVDNLAVTQARAQCVLSMETSVADKTLWPSKYTEPV